jgi:DNA topoisomerase-1
LDHTLVIVESPTKAKTIRKFLPPNYEVLASMGHVRDLPKGAAEIPAAVKKEKWSRIGVNTTEDFEPLYIVPKDKKKVVKELKDALKGANQLLLATDEDREGESISWHLLQILKPKIPTKRMVFHEITKKAINKALDQTREIDMELVQAQETRRILDRLFGYELSPLLWKKVAPRLSAGRVQSVSVRLLVRRERERRSLKKLVIGGLKLP